MQNMTVGSPVKVITKFMIPVLLGNLLQLTYSIADTRIVGSFLGDNALASVGATTVLHTLYIGFFLGTAGGFAITISQKFGAKKYEELRASFAASLLLGSGLAVIMIALTLLFMKPILSFLNIPESLYMDSLGYIRIIIAGMIITMLYDVLLASARAIGDSITPLLILTISVVLNIAGDLILIGLLHFGVWGAAAATVASQCIALIICWLYLYRKYSFFRINISDAEKINHFLIKDMLMAGLSMGFMSSMISIGSFILQTAINDLGNSYIVAQTAARKLTEVLMSILIAVGQTMATYCGQNYGAGCYSRIKKGMRAGYIITGFWCGIVLLIVYLWAPMLITMVTGSGDEIMIKAAAKYLKVDTILYFLVAVIMIQRNSLQGIGDRVTPLISSGIEMIGKIILTYTLVPVLEYNGVILVEPIVWIIMIIPLMIKMNRIGRLKKWQN